MICNISSMHSGAFSRHFDMKSSSMSRMRSISTRYSGFITDAERLTPAFWATVFTAFRVLLCICFVMLLLFPQ
jgi:hypothetical protein